MKKLSVCILKEFYNANMDKKSNEIVLTYPTYATPKEKEVLINSGKIAGFQARLCSESKATLYAYGYEKLIELS